MRPIKKGNKTVMGCSCGFTKKEEAKKIVEKMPEQEEMAIVSEDDQTLPVTDAECDKCDNKKAYFWMLQTRAGDEPETRFFRCTECKHTWREYS